MSINEQKLNTFLEHATYDLSAGYMGVMISLGHKLGLYKALAGRGKIPAEEVALRAECDLRYTQEWLNSQVSGGYLEYYPDTKHYEMTEEQAVVLADEDSPYFIPLAWNTPASMWLDEEKTIAVFRQGEGLGWDQHHERLFCGVAAFFRNNYRANLVENWLPSLNGACDKLKQGIRVADVGCGYGHSSIIMAKAYPNSEFFGFDIHKESIEQAREYAKEAGVSDRVHFEVATAKTVPDYQYDLVCLFDCLHDMGDPVGAIKHIGSVIDKDASVMLVEPFAEDKLEDNINPIARMYYAASTTLCCAHSKSEEVGLALGAQAGFKRLQKVFSDAGFVSFNKTTETPFNIVLQATAA